MYAWTGAGRHYHHVDRISGSASGAVVIDFLCGTYTTGRAAWVVNRHLDIPKSIRRRRVCPTCRGAADATR